MASQRQGLQHQRLEATKSACRILVTDPQLHPSNFTAYKVTMHVMPESIFQEEYQVVIYKRYTDFQRIHKQLSELHARLQRRDRFPPLPEAAYFNRFDPKVIEERRHAAEAALKFCAERMHLRQHSLFQAFFQSGVRTAGPPPPVPPPLSALATPAVAFASAASATGFSSSPDETSSPSPPPPASQSRPPPLLSRSTSAASGGLPDVSEFDPFVVSSVPATSAVDSSSNAAFLSALTLTMTSPSSDLPPQQSGPQYLLDGGNDGSLMQLQQHHTPTELEDEMLMSRLHSLRLVIADEDRPQLPPAPPPLDESPSPLSSQPPAPPYLTEAAGHVTAAQRHEAAGDFALAFAEYKAGVEILLGGVQLDGDSERRAEVKRKTGQYLRRAEAIYDRYLDAASAAIQKITRPYKELNNYTVIGTIGSVILVINKLNQQRFVIKTVCKSACDLSGFPVDIAFMCRLRAVLISEWTQFLLLEHVPGGRLYAFVRRYQPTDEDDNLVDEDTAEDADASADASPLSDQKQRRRRFRRRSQRGIGGHGRRCLRRSRLHRRACDCDVSDTDEDGEDPDDDDGFAESIGCDSVRVGITPASAALASVRVFQSMSRQSGAVSAALAGASHHRAPAAPTVVDVGVCDLSYAQLFRDYAVSAVSASPASTSTAAAAAAEEATTATFSNFMEVGRHSDAKDVDSDDGLRRAPADAVASPSASASSSRPGGHYRGRALSSVFAQIVDSVLGSSGSAALSDRRGSQGGGLPEPCVRQWGAELVTGLAQLHLRGLFFGCLLPSDVLLGNRGHLRLTYRYRRTRLTQALRASPYCAPEWREVPGGTPPRPQVGDWWGLGCHLLMMLTGCCVCRARCPACPLRPPDWISPEARHLLIQLLCPEPAHRLGSGAPGADEIRQHAFFRGVDWAGLATKAY